MPPHPLTNLEIQNYYQNESKFNDVYSRNSLPKIKNGAYVINLDEYKSIGTYWIALYVNGNNVTCFDSFGLEHIPKENKKFIGNKNVITNVYRIQACDSAMCGYFWIGFIDFMLKVKSLLDYTDLFSRNESEKNDEIILKYIQKLKSSDEKINSVFCSKYTKFKKILKLHTFLKKQFFLLFAISAKMKMKKYLKKKNQSRY